MEEEDIEFQEEEEEDSTTLQESSQNRQSDERSKGTLLEVPKSVVNISTNSNNNSKNALDIPEIIVHDNLNVNQSIIKPEKATSRHKKLTKARHFDQYSFSVPHIELKADTLVSKKFKYILDEALSDLGFRNIMSIEFWISLIILLLTIWIRAYLHTFGSWILLKMGGIPVSHFDTMMYFS